MLTDTELRSLKAHGKRYDVRAGKVPGLVLRVYPSGKRVWQLVYDINKKRRRLTLGTYPDALTLGQARTKAKRLRVLIEEGRDPAHERIQERHERAAALTVADLVERYVEQHLCTLRAPYEPERLLRKHLVKRLGTRPITSITRADVLDFRDYARSRIPGTGANRCFGAMRACFNWAAEEGLLPVSPAAGVKAPRPERPSTRFLTEGELAIFWHNLDETEAPPVVRAILRMQLLTALRLGEVSGARWGEFDLKARTWMIPPERMKAGLPHLVHLSAPALRIVKAAKAVSPRPSEFVFPSRTGRPFLSSSIGRIVKRTAADLGLEFTTHTLRKSASDHMLRLGVSPAVVDAILAHKPTGVLGRHYAVYAFEKERAQALEAWARHLTHLPKPGGPE